MIISFSEEKETFNAEIKVEQTVSTNDYNKLVNKPTLNGKPLVGDVWEEDPNVKAITIEELSKMWKGL